MKKSGSVAALVAALVLACGVIAWEWYSHVGAPNAAAPAPVQAVTPAPTPVAPTATPGPVVYVPVQPTASPTIAPAAAATAAPTASAQPAATAAPSAAPSAAPTATPTLEPLKAGERPSPGEMPVEAATIAPAHIRVPPVIRVPPNAPPRILAMSLSSPVAHGGDVVTGTVETSSNVASVEARVGGYGQVMKKIGVGKFTMTYRVPKLPFFLHRTYLIQVIARNSSGLAVSSAIPITIR